MIGKASYATRSSFVCPVGRIAYTAGLHTLSSASIELPAIHSFNTSKYSRCPEPAISHDVDQIFSSRNATVSCPFRTVPYMCPFAIPQQVLPIFIQWRPVPC